MTLAFVAYDVQDDPFAEDGEFLSDFLWNRQVVVVLTLEVNDPVTTGAVQMVVALRLRVETSWSAVSLDDIGDADLSKRQKRPVHCVKRDAGKLLADDLEHCRSRRMVFRAGEFPENSDTLRRHFEIMPSAFLHERREMFGIVLALHRTALCAAP